MVKEKYKHYTFTDYFLFALAFGIGVVTGMVVVQAVV